MHYTHQKWKVDVDVLIDDSPAKLGMFKYNQQFLQNQMLLYRDLKLY